MRHYLTSSKAELPAAEEAVWVWYRTGPCIYGTVGSIGYDGQWASDRGRILSAIAWEPLPVWEDPQ